MRALAVALVVLISCPSLAAMKLGTFLAKPKLVVVVVIDQFRADYLTRFEKRFLPAGRGSGVGGFRYLMAKGAYFPFAEYELLQNMTCPGHATILTGASPVGHKIAINDFWDAEMGADGYCVDDKDAPIVGLEGGGSSGRRPVSPKRLKATTVGDELKAAGYASRVVGIALKDRSAILLGGQGADLAIWFDALASRWVTSKYYVGELPEWVKKLNSRVAARDGEKFVWKSEVETGLSNEFDRGPFLRETTVGAKNWLHTPLGVELTTDAALAAVESMKLGSRPGAPDVLAISYSSHDMLGHRVGPNAREMEELTVAEDRSLSRLFRGLERSVPGGMKNVLVVLTADHGVAPTAPIALKGRLEAGAVNPEALLERLNSAMVAKLGKPSEGVWVVAQHSFNFYLNRKAAVGAGVAAAESALKELLLKEPAAEVVFTRSEVAAGRLPGGVFEAQIKKSYVVGQSGDVVMIPKPFFADDDDPSAHMTGYSYDRTVPLIFAGPMIKPGVHASAARVADLAPTLSFVLGTIAPAKSEGRVLAEALGGGAGGSGSGEATRLPRQARSR